MSESKIDPNQYWVNRISAEEERKVSLNLPESMINQINEAVYREKVANKTGKRISMSSFIRDAISEKLERDLS